MENIHQFQVYLSCHTFYPQPNLYSKADHPKYTQSQQKCTLSFSHGTLMERRMPNRNTCPLFDLMIHKRIHIRTCLFLNNLFIFGCTGPSAWAFLQLWRVGATLQLQCSGFSLKWLLLLQSTGFRAHSSQALQHRLSSCGAWALVASQHVGSSWIRV